jgi:phage I-like protein
MRTRTAALASTLVDLYGSASVDSPRQAPSEFRIFVFGDNPSDQGTWVFDQGSAESVMAEWGKQSRDLPIDWEHQSRAQPPIKAPAAGWFIPAVRPDGLYATNVRWTAEAKSALERAEYRYFSPVFSYDKKSMRVMLLHNAGLTNNPSLYGIEALVAASSRPTTEGEDDMNELEQAKARITELETKVTTLTAELKAKEAESGRAGDQVAALSQAAGLKTGAAPDEVRTAVASLSSLRGQLRTITGSDNDAAALGKIEAWKGEAADATKLKAEKEELQLATCKSNMKAVLDQAITAGKIEPAKREFFETKALSMGGGKPSEDGVQWLTGFVADLPVKNTGHAAGGGPATGPNGQPITPPAGNGVAILSQNGIDLARKAGNDPEKVAAFVEKEIAAGRLI